MLARWLRRTKPQVLDVALSATSTFLVRQTDAYRELVETASQEMVHTRVFVDAPLRSGFAYIDAMHVAMALAEKPAATVALCLGGGGGVLARQLIRFGVRVDLVESSSSAIDLAAKHFGLTSGPLLTIHRDDAATFVERSHDRYDAVLIDLFGPFRASPHLASERFFADVHRLLREGGAVAVNTVGALGGDAGAMLATERALASVFGDVIALPMLSERERGTGVMSLVDPRNVVLLARRGALPSDLTSPYAHADLPALPAALDDANRRLSALATARAQAAASELMYLRSQ